MRSTNSRYGRANSGTGSVAERFDTLLAATSLRGVVVMLVLSLVATVLLGVFAVRANSAQEQYAHAPNCAVSTPASGCLGMASVTIVGKTTNGGKAPSYWLDLSGPAPADGQITMANQYPVWNEVSQGDQVTATVWHGRVVAITDYVDTGDTSNAPAIDVTLYDGLFLGAFVWTGMFALFAFRVRALRDGAVQNWTRAVAPLCFFLFPGGFGLGFGAFVSAQEDASPVWALGTGFCLAAITACSSVISAAKASAIPSRERMSSTTRSASSCSRSER